MAVAARSLPAEPSPLLEDRLGEREFDRLAALIGDQTGIKLPPSKRLMVEGRIRRRLKAMNAPDFATYCRAIFQGGRLEQELPYLIDAITTNKTDFYREPEHYELLRGRLVPNLIAERKGQQLPLLKIWSAAASNGAEAYTAAMVLADLALARQDFRFAILGTDISNSVLQQAETGIYPAEMIAPVPKAVAERYVMQARQPKARADVRIVPELRRLVRFARLNLMDPGYPFDRDVDVIFLRNVLIYFEKADQHAVVERLMGHLRPRGYLLLGHSESMIGSECGLRQIAPAVFQKV